jgi:DNA-binding HxlR family transcriptional regulator
MPATHPPDDHYSRFTKAYCSVARTLELVGDRWTLLILREIFYGNHRFEAFHQNLGIANALLTKRLKTLVDAGILGQELYREPGSRKRYEYVLTDSGEQLLLPIIALLEWGDRHIPTKLTPLLRLVHHECGRPLTLKIECECGSKVSLDEIDGILRPGRRKIQLETAAVHSRRKLKA